LGGAARFRTRLTRADLTSRSVRPALASAGTPEVLSGGQMQPGEEQ
jgi:hypothetical protein